MSSVGSVLSENNQNVLYPKNFEFGCNCWSMTNCPFDNKFLTFTIVYQMFKMIPMMRRNYLGASKLPFKEHFRNHKEKLTHDKYWYSTVVLKYR